MIMIPISIFLDLSANAEYSVTALMNLIKNEVYFFKGIFCSVKG